VGALGRESWSRDGEQQGAGPAAVRRKDAAKVGIAGVEIALRRWPPERADSRFRSVLSGWPGVTIDNPHQCGTAAWLQLAAAAVVVLLVLAYNVNSAHPFENPSE
jgi:hypothetical protein